GRDGLEPVAALGVGELVPAVAEAAVVVVAVLVRMPEIEQRVRRRLAIRGQHAAAHDQAGRLAAALEQRDALRARRLEERSFGFAWRRLAADLGPRAVREREKKRGADEAAAVDGCHAVLLGLRTSKAYARQAVAEHQHMTVAIGSGPPFPTPPS